MVACSRVKFTFTFTFRVYLVIVLYMLTHFRKCRWVYVLNVLLCPALTKRVVRRQMLVKISKSNSMNVRLVGADLLYKNRQMDRRTDGQTLTLR